MFQVFFLWMSKIATIIWSHDEQKKYIMTNPLHLQSCSYIHDYIVFFATPLKFKHSNSHGLY